MPITTAIARKWEMPDASGVSRVLIFDGIIRESHSKRASISKNPMETGVNLADHAIMEPDELTLEIAVSDTPLLMGPDGQPSSPTADNAITFTGSARRSVSAWAELEEWMAAFVPFDVVTGLKTYKSLLIASINADQDKDSSGALYVTAQLQQVLFASTATVVYPARAKKKPTRQASKPVDNGTKNAPAATVAQKQVADSLAVQLGLPGA
jgi:hypothetical protein